MIWLTLGLLGLVLVVVITVTWLLLNRGRDNGLQVTDDLGGSFSEKEARGVLKACLDACMMNASPEERVPKLVLIRRCRNVLWGVAQV